MADIFLQGDARELLKGKTIVYIGDSNIRACYKDLLQLINNNKFISQEALRRKLEPSFSTDKLLARSRLTIGREYVEERCMSNNICCIHYFFVTKCYGEYMEDVIKSMQEKIHPDIIVMTSCLWDICRWGPNSVSLFKKNLPKLMNQLDSLPKCLVIWMTALPVSSEVHGPILPKQLGFLEKTLRFHVMEANQFASNIVKQHGLDVLDLHFYMQMQTARMTKDGVHWKPEAIRHITNLLLTHISTAFNVLPLPRRFVPTYMRIYPAQFALNSKPKVQIVEPAKDIEK